MSVVVARMIAKLEAETSGFHARWTAAEQQVHKWSSTTATGTRSTQILNNTLQQLSFQAAGIPGPIGKAASAIGMLGVGGGPVMVAVAAVGAFGLAWKSAAADAELAAQNVVAAAERMQKNLTAAIQRATPAAFQSAIADAEARLAVLKLTPITPDRDKYGMPTASPEVLAFRGKTNAEIRADEITALETFIRQLRVAMGKIDPARIEADENRRRNERLEEIKFLQGTIALERSGVFQALRPGFNAPAFGSSYNPGPAGDPTFANIRRNVPRFVPGEAKPGQGLPAEFYLMSAMAMVQGLQSGSVGGFLGAAAAPAAMINPMAGLITGTLGSLFSMFEGRESERERQEERRHKELIGALHEGPARVTVLSADDPEADLYALRRQERLGGEPRLGGL